MNQLILFAWLCIFGYARACWGGDDTTTTTRRSSSSHNKSKKYWTPKPGMKAEWDAWHFAWKQTHANKTNQTDSYEDDDDDGGDDSGPGTGAPYEWKGMGPGKGGQEPPPWAVLKNDGGKAHYCFEQPNYGGCSQKQTRWGYNPFTEECEEFIYSGCGGNMNNFRDKTQCQATCAVSPHPNCAIYADDY